MANSYELYFRSFSWARPKHDLNFYDTATKNQPGGRCTMGLIRTKKWKKKYQYIFVYTYFSVWFALIQLLYHHNLNFSCIYAHYVRFLQLLCFKKKSKTVFLPDHKWGFVLKWDQVNHFLCLFFYSFFLFFLSLFFF